MSEYTGTCPNCSGDDIQDNWIDDGGHMPEVDRQDLKCEDCGVKFTITCTWEVEEEEKVDSCMQGEIDMDNKRQEEEAIRPEAITKNIYIRRDK